MADKYLGTLGGEDFSTVKATVEWLIANPLSGDQNVYFTSGGSDTTPITLSGVITLNGYELNISVEDSTWNGIKSNHLNWFEWTFDDGCGLILPIGDVGISTVQRMRYSAIHKNAGFATGGAIVNNFASGSNEATYNVRDLIVKGGLNQTGIGSAKDCINVGTNRNKTYINVERVIATEGVRYGINANIATFSPGSFLDRKYMKNCASYNNGDSGIEIEGHASYNWILQNTYSVENVGSDWVWVGADNSTKQSLADSDSSLPVGQTRGIVIGNEVQSVDITSADFLKLLKGTIEGTAYTPGSAYLGQTGIDSGLTSDILGRAIPGADSLYSIGPMEQQYYVCHTEIDTASEANIRKFHSKIEVTWTDPFIDNSLGATANDTNRIHDV